MTCIKISRNTIRLDSDLVGNRVTHRMNFYEFLHPKRKKLDSPCNERHHNDGYADQGKIKNPLFMRVCEIEKFAYNYMPKIWGIGGFCGIGIALLAAFVHTDGMKYLMLLYGCLI